MKKITTALLACLLVATAYSGVAIAEEPTSDAVTVHTSWAENYDTLGDLSADADLIVTGTVESSYTELRHDIVMTHNLVSVNGTIKGSSLGTVDVVQTGGTYGSVYTPTPEEFPLLNENVDYIFYLDYVDDPTYGDYYLVKGGYQGVGIVTSTKTQPLTVDNANIFGGITPSSVNANTPAADHGCIWTLSSLNCYIDPTVSGSYGTSVRSAVATGARAWNSTNAPTVSVAATGTSSHIGINMMDYGPTTWNGRTTTHFNTSSGVINGAEIRLNEKGLEDYVSDTGLWQALTCHEMGHALGLGHNTSSSSSVMHSATTDYYNYRGSSPKIRTPQTADRNGMNSIYD